MCLIVYASLHPFTGWTWPEPLDAGLLRLSVPRPSGVSRFDIWSNLLAYMPMGALLCAAALRSQRSAFFAFCFALLACSALSYGLETVQHLLPRRVPSLIDWLINATGALLGALTALTVKACGGLDLWQRWRERWLLRERGAGLTLLLLWPCGLLFPPPLPFGLGQLVLRTREALDEALEGTAWDGWLGAGAPPSVPLAPGVELLCMAAGLLAPTLLAYALTRPGARRLVLPLGAVALGTSATTLSTALGFGPEHALTWFTPPVLPAMALATVAAVALAWVPPRAAAAVALVVISLGVALVNIAPADAYYAASLSAWEQGRFIRFHGLTQWIGWLWPWATLAYLMGRVAAPAD